MADNPLFPGYIPKKEGDSDSPLFPGYSEGQRAYRPPPGTPLSKYEYNADYWLEQLDQMSFDAGNLPKWFLDRYVDDFKSNLKANYNPDSIPVEQMDDYDQDVMPGVSSISLSLDPMEWQDPGKVLEKTAKSWIKAGTGLRFQKKGWGLEAWPVDLTDYDTRIKAGMWRVAMGLEDDVSDLGRAGGVAVTSATKAMAGSPDRSEPLFNFKDADYVVGVGKIYESMAKNVVDVQKVMQASQKREGKYDSFMSSLSSAIGAELNGKYDVPDLDSFGVQKVDSNGNPLFISKNRVDLFSQLYSDPKQAKDFKDAVTILAEKNKLANDMDLVMGGAITGQFGLKGALKARISGSTDAEARWDTLESPTGTQTRFDAKMASLKTNISNRLSATGNDSIDQIIERIKNIDPASATALQKHTDMYKEYLSKVQDALNTYNGDDRQLLNKISNITVKGKELTGGGLFDSSIHRNLLRQMESDVILPGKLTKVDKRFQIGTYLSELEQLSKQPNANGVTLEQLFKNDGQDYKGFFANKARMVASRLEIDRGSYAIQEFYDSVTEGRFMERYVWNRISKRLVGYTPGELATQTLSKVGYFGLSIDDDYISNGLRNSKLFNSVFRNKFTVELDNTSGIFQGGAKIKAKFLGDKHLAAVGTLGNTLSNVNALGDDALLDLLRGTTKITDTVLDKSGNLVKLYGKNLPGFWSKDDHFLETVQKQIDNFQEWLKTNGAAVGISWADFRAMDANTQKQVLALFHGLNKENQFYGSLKITKEFSGAIQRIGVGLNRLQNKIFGFALFQRIIRPALQIKTIIAEKISDVVATLISKFATKGIHVLTGGASVVFDYLIEKVLKPLVRFITRKVVEFSQNFIGALAQGDISKAMAQVDKEIGAIIKFSMYVVGIPLVIMFMFMGGMFGTVLTTISPIDPTRGNGGYGTGGGIPIPQGENELVKINKNVDVLAGGQSFTNPATPFANSDLELTLTYTLEIIPKVAFEGTITYSDVVTVMTKTTEVETTLVSETSVDGPFEAGVPITITLKPTFKANTPDSLISNVFTVNTPAVGDLTEDTVTYTRNVRVGESPFPEGCFVFEGPWPSANQATFEIAIQNIGQNGGAFYGDLCGTIETITLLADPAYSGCNAERFGTVLHFGTNCTLSSDWATFWLAHEAMHVYQGSVGMKGFSSFVSGELGMPTYPYSSSGGNCYAGNGCDPNNICPTEDMAESFGNYFFVNRRSTCWGGDRNSTWGSSYDEFWSNFPKHKQFIEEYIILGK